MGLFSFLFGQRSEAETPASKPNSSGIGRSLRQMILSTPVAESGEKPSKDFPRVYAILMDFPIGGEHTATVLAGSSGGASLYTTSTFGLIGGEGHATVRAAASRFVREADRLVDASSPTTEFPYPAAGKVRFYLLTFDGVRVVEADMAAIEKGTSPMVEFFALGQNVLTELRLTTQKR